MSPMDTGRLIDLVKRTLIGTTGDAEKKATAIVGDLQSRFMLIERPSESDTEAASRAEVDAMLPMFNARGRA